MLPFKLPDSPSYAVAFSGGADSRLLLELTVRALLERDGEGGRSRVVALHLHHGIRGDAGDHGVIGIAGIAVGVQVAGVGIRVSTLRPPVAVRTLIDGSARFSAHDA